jgi:signal transduction histidine kinase
MIDFDQLATSPVDATGKPSRSIYSEILKGLMVGIIVLDRKNRTVFFHNPWTSDILGNRVDLNDYDSVCELFLQHAGNSTGREQPDGKQWKLRLGNSILGYTVYQPFENHTAILFQDITEKARLESIAEAVEVTNNLGYIFSQIRHELGNPTNSIKMTMEVLRNNVNNYSKETILNYVDRALADVGRVEYLLKSLRNFSLYEDMEIRDCCMHSFMKNLLPLVEGTFTSMGIRMITRIDPAPIYGLIDPRALQQVMLNIVSNAMDALGDRPSPMITIGMKKSGRLVAISFEDNGFGIPDEHRDKVFTAFFTLKPKGTGLGLPIAARMLARMNSTIEIASEENAGTTVTISIPEGSADGAEILPYVFEKPGPITPESERSNQFNRAQAGSELSGFSRIKRY